MNHDFYIQEDDNKDENIYETLFKYHIFISGEIPSCANSKLMACLSDRYDLYCYDSNAPKDKKESK